MPGRPQKQTVEYFSHDANAGSGRGRTLPVLFNHFGHEGLSAWWLLLEHLASTRNHFIVIKNTEDWETLSASMHFKPERLKEILAKMADLEAIDAELFSGGIIWCQHFVDRLEPVYKARKQDIPSKPDLFNIIGVAATVKKPESQLSGKEMPLSGKEIEFPVSENTQRKELKKGTKEKRESPHAFGELKNVNLTPNEHESLIQKLGGREATRWIDELSLAKASKGIRPKSDYATVLAWERRERRLKSEKRGDSGANRQGSKAISAAELKASVGVPLD